MRRAAILLASIFAVGATALPAKTARLSAEAARERCIQRTQTFALSGFGPSGREPSAYEVRSTYQRCFYGYTRQRASEVVVYDRNNRSFTLQPRGSK